MRILKKDFVRKNNVIAPQTTNEAKLRGHGTGAAGGRQPEVATKSEMTY